MPLKSLEHLASQVAFGTLPANWNTFDLVRFSPEKTLWDYQQQAVRLALAVLFKFYEEFEDFVPGEDQAADATRRMKLSEWYTDGMHLSAKDQTALSLSLARAKTPLRDLIAEFFPVTDEDPRLDFERLCNRMGFWMATGSGKTLVLVKLLEILHLLMRRQEIPTCDVLMLTHREDLIEQFQKTIAEYNHAPNAPTFPAEPPEIPRIFSCRIHIRIVAERNPFGRRLGDMAVAALNPSSTRRDDSSGKRGVPRHGVRL